MSRLDLDDPDEPPEKRLARAVRTLGSAHIAERMEAAARIARFAGQGIVPRATAVVLIAPHLDEPVLRHALAFAVSYASADPAGAAPRLHALLDRAFSEGTFPDIAFPFREALAHLISLDPALAGALRARAEAAVRDAPGTPAAAMGAVVLGEIAAAGDGSAVRPLIALLNSTDQACSLAATFALAKCGRPEALDAIRAILDERPGEKLEMALPGLEASSSVATLDALIRVRETPERGWSENERPFAARKRDFVLYRLRNIRESVQARVDRAKVALPDLSRL